MEIEIQTGNDKSLAELMGYNGSIYFGIPRETSERKAEKISNGENISNADIMLIMERGSPIMNIPARPWLEPACMKHKSEIRDAFSVIFNHLAMGNKAEADKQMEILAQRIERWIKSYMREDNGWAPNSPITIHGGWMKNKVTGKPVYVKGKGSDRPLFDTGALLGAIRSIFVKGE